VIEAAELDEWAQRFGVSVAQIRRDHFISYILRALGDVDPGIRFFGGTALCRTYLDPTRLSEDVDLLHPDPQDFLERLQDELSHALRREFPHTTWSALSPDGDGVAAFLGSPNVDAIKIYVGREGPNTSAWEFIETLVHLRYSDLPAEHVFHCPTAASFAAMKLAAWCDRHAPRDLYDLAGLAALGTLRDPDVSRIFKQKMGIGIIMAEFESVPVATAKAWVTELAAQVGHLPSPYECLAQVRSELAAAD
jgi:hypothetical protein